MMSHHRKFAGAFARLSLALTPLIAGCAVQRPAVEAAPPAPAATTAPAPVSDGPALWRLSDADTTIYLFGTVHALPKDAEWFRGPVAAALAEADVVVTEIAPGAMKDPAVQQAFLARAMLPEGQSLRDLLTAEQRSVFEAALTRLDLPLAAFDKVEPWFAAITLGTVPMLKAGYSLEAGVEQAIEGKVAPTVRREALETVDDQLALFDGMPMAQQTAYLVSVAEKSGSIAESMNAMVAAWSAGDADRLAALMNAQIDDAELADRVLYARNRAWAQWIQQRMAQPGKVFIAVGAGHLAGSNSVQDYLAKAGVSTTRVK